MGGDVLNRRRLAIGQEGGATRCHYAIPLGTAITDLLKGAVT